MAGYDDTYQMIISTLMGRPVGTEIQPDSQQAYEINMLNYIRSLELIANGPLIGIAEANTQPIQPNDARACYIAGVAQDRTVTFQNFRNYLGQPIQITNGQMEACLVILIWDTQYWSATQVPTNIISAAEQANFYYNFNVRKTYPSVAAMNADKDNPIGTDGKYIKVGDIVTVVNSTTPSENGVYSYEGTTDGWKFQSSFNFQVEQTRSQNPNTSPSSKLFDDEFSSVRSDLRDIDFKLEGISYKEDIIVTTGVETLQYFDISIPSGTEVVCSCVKKGGIITDFRVYFQFYNQSGAVVTGGDFGIYPYETKTFTLPDTATRYRIYIAANSVKENGTIETNVITNIKGIQDDIEKLNQQIIPLRSDLTDLRSDLTDLESETNRLDDNFGQVNADLYGDNVLPKVEGSWDYMSGQEIAPQTAYFNVDIKTGEKYRVEIGTYTGSLYYYINDVSKGHPSEGIFTADTNINKFSFYLTGTTDNGTLDISIMKLSGGCIVEEVDNMKNIIPNIVQSISSIDNALYGKEHTVVSGSWSYTSGGVIYQQTAYLNVDIKSGKSFRIETGQYTGVLYYYINDVSKGLLNAEDFIAETDITKLSFFLTSTTDSGTLQISVMSGPDIGLVQEVYNKNPKLIAGVGIQLTDTIDGKQVISSSPAENYEQIASGEWNYSSDIYHQNTFININLDEYSIHKIVAEYGSGRLYYYLYINNEWVPYGLVKSNIPVSFPNNATKIGFYLTSPSGPGQLEVSIFKKRIYRTYEEGQNRITLSDCVANWIRGEKCPIGFLGDSTTDGTGTTGWAVNNSHPAQDEAVGGAGARGVVDYVCEKAYPRLLEKLLQSEFGNTTMRIYNIGYYGSSIKGQLSWLDKIFGDVYSDTKMVGIALGINDRGEVSSLDKDVSYGQYYANVKAYLIQMVEWLISHHFEPFMVTNQIVIQIGSSTDDIPVFAQEARNGIQTMCNKAKIEVAKLYNLEVIDMNSFGELLLKSSNVSVTNLIQDRLHFNDLGHRLEAGYLFSELIPYVYKTNNTSVLHIGLNTRNFNTDIACAKYIEATTDGYKYQLNKDRQEQTDILVFDCYIFVNSDNGAYNVKYLTPYASGYIVIDGDTTNPISITSTEINLGTWDIGLHHVQVYTGTSSKVAFKGFLLEQ